MTLPKDPYMMLSILNMKLRDSGEDLNGLCREMDADEDEIAQKMAQIGYTYSEAAHQFVSAK